MFFVGLTFSLIGQNAFLCSQFHFKNCLYVKIKCCKHFKAVLERR